jgi:large subunit ribosomal protein L19
MIMPSITQQIEEKYKKHAVVDVRPGDSVRVHQKIREGNKERIQIFEGLVIRVSKKDSLSSTIVVRRVTGGLGVEKSYLLHSPFVVKVEVTKRSKVRRNYLTYMRARTGKAARLTGIAFDKKVNDIPGDPAIEAAKKATEAKEAETAEASTTEPTNE